MPMFVASVTAAWGCTQVAPLPTCPRSCRTARRACRGGAAAAPPRAPSRCRCQCGCPAPPPLPPLLRLSMHTSRVCSDGLDSTSAPDHAQRLNCMRSSASRRFATSTSKCAVAPAASQSARVLITLFSTAHPMPLHLHLCARSGLLLQCSGCWPRGCRQRVLQVEVRPWPQPPLVAGVRAPPQG